MQRLRGLSAFPLTPLRGDAVDEAAFTSIVRLLARAKVDSITALGSTGSYAYLSRAERARVAQLAAENAGNIPVIVGVGALRTKHVLEHIDDAVNAGADGVLLAPMTYQPLTGDEVVDLYEAASAHSRVPIVVYDNPATTHVTFTLDMYARIAQLPGVASIKIPPVPADHEAARQRVAEVRAVIPEHVTIGVSGDAAAANGLNAGCEIWYSVIGGTLPDLALKLVRANPTERRALSEQLAPLWSMFQEFGGSLRVVAAIAEWLELVPPESLPLPIRGLNETQRQLVARIVRPLIKPPLAEDPVNE